MSYLLYSIILAFASFISIGLGIYGWLHRDKPGMLAFSIFMILSAVWPMAQAFDINTANLILKIFLMKIRIDTPVFAGLAYLVMVIQLIGRSNWITRERLTILSIIPLLGVFFNWTSPNILFRYNFHISLSGPFPILLWSNGPFFYIWFLYALAIYFVPLFILLSNYRNISPLSSRQIIILVVATSVPIFTNILFQMNITPIFGFNLTPVTTIFMGLIIAWGIFYYKAFDTVPIARSKLITDMNDGMVALDAKNLVVDINPAAEQMTGLIADKILGHHAKEVFASWPDFINRFKDVQEDQTEITVGEKPNYYDLRITALKDQKGNRLGRMLILRDITERKQAEDALRQNEGMLRAVLNQMPSGVTIRDAVTGDLILSNNMSQEIMGDLVQTSDQFSQYSGFHSDSRPYLAEEWPLNRTIKSGEVVDSEEIYYERADGNRITLSISSVPVHDSQQQIINAVSVFNDITERKLEEKRKQELLEMEQQLTEELLSSNEELQATTEEFTSTNEELMYAQDNLKDLVSKLEISNKELEQFAYVASHDLQEPLRMVSSFSQLLERNYKNKLDTDADEYIEFIVEGSQRMKYLIDDLLTFSRVSSEAKKFEKVNLENVLDVVLSNLSVSIKENNVSITHDPLPTIIADKSQMGQVLQNLIYNAIKFHGDKPPEIHITAEKHGKEWRFSVTDNGIGIDPEYQKQIFEIFKRLHTRQKYPGSGIGLSVTQKIIKQHGGNIWVESKLGEGSTFYFTIPIN